MSAETVRLIRDEGGGGGGGGRRGVWRWGKREIICLSLHCHHQNDSCIKMGGDESHFNVWLIVRDKVTRHCPQTTPLAVKWEPKQTRTKILLLTSLTPYARPNRLPCTCSEHHHYIRASMMQLTRTNLGCVIGPIGQTFEVWPLLKDHVQHFLVRNHAL